MKCAEAFSVKRNCPKQKFKGYPRRHWQLLSTLTGESDPGLSSPGAFITLDRPYFPLLQGPLKLWPPAAVDHKPYHPNWDLF